MSTRKVIRGFSLLEMVIAIFIIGFGVVGWLTFLLRGMALMTDVELRDQAVIIAHRVVEELKSNPKNANQIIETHTNLIGNSFSKGTLEIKWSDPPTLKIAWQPKRPSKHSESFYQISFIL